MSLLEQRYSLDAFMADSKTVVPSEVTKTRSNRSTSSVSTANSTGSLRLADVVKEHGLGVHVENWRDDMVEVRQYLPMQHIIGSLKRDRDEQVRYVNDISTRSLQATHTKYANESLITSPSSDDSFLHEIRSLKRRRTSSQGSISDTSHSRSDAERRFSYQSKEHVSKDISQSALPGLNHILNLSTITAEERDLFSEYAPRHLDDTQILLKEVLQLRERMCSGAEAGNVDNLHSSAKIEDEDDQQWPLIIPVERDDEVTKAFEDSEVRKAFETFVDAEASKRFIAKL